MSKITIRQHDLLRVAYRHGFSVVRAKFTSSERKFVFVFDVDTHLPTAPPQPKRHEIRCCSCHSSFISLTHEMLVLVVPVHRKACYMATTKHKGILANLLEQSRPELSVENSHVLLKRDKLHPTSKHCENAERNGVQGRGRRLPMHRQ